MDNNWKLAIGLAILLFGGGFLLIFFLGSTLDYTETGAKDPNNNPLRNMLPNWLFPPPR